MPEKTVNARKKIILLRSRWVSIFVSVVLLACVLVSPVSAAHLDYNDYVTNVTVDGDNDIVTVSFPVDQCHIQLWSCDSTLLAESFNNLLAYNFASDTDYTIEIFPIYPNDLLLSNIPDGTLFVLEMDNDISELGFYDAGRLTAEAYFRYFGPYHETEIVHSAYELTDSTWAFELDKQDSYYGDFDFRFMNVNLSLADSDGKTFSVKSFTLQMSISSLYRLQQETGKTNAILSEVEKQLEEQGKTLDEVLQQQQQTNDKLDDMQGSIETLPGQIGDEMQGVVDKEKDEANSSGNKFVDQLLDALPDPSTDVLAALKGLTDATAYTGTDAVLPIPAIVLPGIDGLFPETEIWGGAEFDFGEYIGMLPPTLLTLVQALFTIAIVLYCVYELKGIISYCLTLRESKGG